MSLTVQLAPIHDLPGVRYQWDPDTDILSATVDAPPDGAAGAVREGAPAAVHSGAIEVEGTDGSWLTLEIVRGRIGGVQVAVWPTVRRRTALTPPAAPACAAFAQAEEGAAAAPGPVSLELSARVAVETDGAERIFHFLIGPPRPTETARIAADVVLELDSRRRLAGVWLLNVPPFPQDP
jgi:hypothetical protein